MPSSPQWRLFDNETGSPVTDCLDIDGLFDDRPFPSESGDWPPGPPVTLRGCRPGPAVAPGTAFDGELAHLRADGTVHRLDQYKIVSGRVLTSRPSTFGDGRVDLTTTARIPSPLTAADRPIWDMWHTGGPAERNTWAPLDRSGRYRWSQAALVHRTRVPDRPAGTVYHLDGRHVTDFDAFFCALGEAINGPGGWFGSGLFWLHDSLCGGAGATAGFRLIWHDAQVARTHLLPGHDHLADDEAVTFDQLAEALTTDGVRLDLR